MSITLAQLIHDVADASQDLTQATASVNAGGNTTFTDPNSLLEEDDHFRGCEAYFTSGLNAGLTRRVYGSDYETGTLTFTPALPNPILAGTTVELYNLGSAGRMRYQYKNIINRLIREASTNSMDPVVVSLVGTYAGAQEIPVPAGINSVCSVQYYDSLTLLWVPIKRAIGYGKRGWFPIRDSASIGLSYDWTLLLNGYSLRFKGYAVPTVLSADTDVTNVDPEWLIESAAGIAQMSNPDNYNNLGPGQYNRNRADNVRGKMGAVPAPGCARIR